jgi:hypothetical protein
MDRVWTRDHDTRLVAVPVPESGGCAGTSEACACSALLIVIHSASSTNDRCLHYYLSYPLESDYHSFLLLMTPLVEQDCVLVRVACLHPFKLTLCNSLACSSVRPFIVPLWVGLDIGHSGQKWQHLQPELLVPSLTGHSKCLAAAQVPK